MKGYNKPLTRDEFVQNLIRADAVIIVEGEKDFAKLEKLGITNVIQLSHESLCSFTERIAESYDKVILLMDNDVEGRKLFSRLKQGFSRFGVKVVEEYQKELADLKVSHVEGL